jgi:hypothetical protein
MPAKDLFHDPLVRALIRDGRTVTDDPLTLKVGDTDFFVDVGAERFVTAEKGMERIAVEVKSFLKLSAVQDLKEAIGQFVLYEDVLSQSSVNADRILFLAIREETYTGLFSNAVGQMVLTNRRVRLIVFDPVQEVIRQWVVVLPA